MTTETIHIDTAEVAKIIRQELKKAFPTIKFSVNSKRYSGGSSIRVDWTDGPTKTQVEAIVGQFQGATFDGMRDLKEYHSSEYNGQEVSFGNDFLFFDRHHSDTALLSAIEWYKGYWANPQPVVFVPQKNIGKCTLLAYIQTDYDTERKIYNHLHETEL